MKNLIGSLFTAFSLYSVIPMPKTEWNRQNIRYALCFMPLIGIVIGVASLAWYEFCSHFKIVPALYATVATLLPLFLSGGIHLDGFIDTADALACHGVQEKRQAVLKDPHVGAFGVIYCATLLLLSFGLWQQLYQKPKLMALVAVGYIISRALNALSIVTFPTAKNSGLAYFFSDSAAKPIVMVSCLLWVGTMFFVAVKVSPLWGAITIVVIVLYFLWHRRFCDREFGGNSGDLAGFFLENVELLLLVIAVTGGIVV